MTTVKRLSIILLSYNDLRVERAIKSIRSFDDLNTVELVVIDGNSNDEVKSAIRRNLTESDVFISEPDDGIFDALNKGLDSSRCEFIGWLGSDDLFTGNVKSSEVVNALEKHDLFIANLQLFHNGFVTRITHSLPAKLGLVKYGFNNPHFSTFGRSELLKSEKFRLGIRGSDIEYFLKLFNAKPRIICTDKVATLQ